MPQTAHLTAHPYGCVVTAHRLAVENRVRTLIVQFGECAGQCAVRKCSTISKPSGLATATLHFFLRKSENMKKREKRVIETGNTRARPEVRAMAFPAGSVRL